MQGDQGPKGLMGLQGAPGQKGIQGRPGNEGEMGPTGKKVCIWIMKRVRFNVALSCDSHVTSV